MADLTVVKDSVYSFEIARRAVGRAALHLGIDSMTEQTLDVMADVLLQYLSRTGKAMSVLAESSRRTSAHVNVLDAFQACQLVASPAVARLHLQEPEEEENDIIVAASAKTTNGAGTESSNGGSGANPVGTTSASVPSNGGMTQPSNASTSSPHSSTGWKGLAAFVFGPNWLQEKDEDEYLMELAASRNTDASNGEGRELSSGGAGGKVLPSSLENGDGGDGGMVGEMGTLGRKRNRRKGWDAPYPDEVAAFPRASPSCANPHALPPRVTGVPSTATTNDGVSSYRKVDVDAEEAEEDAQDAENELKALSDEVFLTSPETMDSNVAAFGDSAWGSIDGKRKRKVDAETDTVAKKDEVGDVEMQPTSKKVKFEDGRAKAGDAKGGTSSKKGSGVSISAGEAGAKGDKDSEEEEYLYIPNFYPRPPSMKVVVDDRRTVVDDMDDRQERLLQQQRTQEQQEQQVFASADLDEMLDGASTTLRDNININSSKGIRSSLIRIGNYWGSGWDKVSSSSTTSATSNLAVPMGRKVVNPSASGGAGGRAAPEDPIVPMSRASGSRVSRVLEGSMDAAAMQ